RDGGTSTAPGASDSPSPTGNAGRCGTAGVRGLSGVVWFPNASLPVAGALVYVPRGSTAAAHPGQCGECVDRGALLAHATTGPEGSFELTGLEAGTHTVVIEKGKFQRTFQVQVGAEGCTELSAEQTRLPRNQMEGRIPRIAVVAGHFDHM